MGTAPSLASTPISPPATSGHSPTLSLRLRIMVVALLPMLVAVGLFAAYFTHLSISRTESNLINRGQDSVRRLAEGIAYALFTGNLPYVKRQMDLERKSLGASTVAIYDGQEWILLSGVPEILPKLRGPMPPRQSRSGRLYFFSHPVSLPAPPETDPYLAQDTRPHNPTAYAFMVLTREPVELARSQVGLAAVGMAILSIGLALGLAWHLAGVVSRPLHAITNAVARISQGALDERVREDSPGELGQLQQGVNRMASRLEEHQRVLEQRIQEATAELRAQKQHAEAATLAKSRFLAAASHDLRQPLHALSLLVEALQERVPDGEARRLADHISSSASNMQDLLNALLDLSRLDAGVVEARPECFPLSQIMANLELQFAPMAAVKGLRLRLRHSNLWLYSDPALLERILANLISNALRYTSSGGVLVGARRTRDHFVRLEVWDTGKGIPAEYQNLVFEEYFQLANPERHRDKGLGLGLAIVARLTRLLGSQVQVHSRMDRGSCFSLRFARCDGLQQSTQERPSAQRVAMPLQNALVAFIDDDESILEAMVEMFDQWGVALAAGENGEQVKQELLELGRKPDVILSDFRLKDGLTGTEAIANLQEAFGPLPAALITGDTAPDTIQALRLSGLPILYKPLKPAKLRAFLAHLLSGNPDHPIS